MNILYLTVQTKVNRLDERLEKLSPCQGMQYQNNYTPKRHANAVQ